MEIVVDVELSFTVAELDLIKKAATSLGYSISDYVHTVIIKNATKDYEDHPRAQCSLNN